MGVSIATSCEEGGGGGRGAIGPIGSMSSGTPRLKPTMLQLDTWVAESAASRPIFSSSVSRPTRSSRRFWSGSDALQNGSVAETLPGRQPQACPFGMEGLVVAAAEEVLVVAAATATARARVTFIARIPVFLLL